MEVTAWERGTVKWSFLPEIEGQKASGGKASSVAVSASRQVRSGACSGPWG